MSSRRSSKSSRTKDKWRSKIWYTIVAPDIFNNAEIGLTPADEPGKLIGRVIEVPLSDLTNDFNQIHIKMYFKINDVKGTTAYTRFHGHSWASDYLRGQVRRGSSRIDAIVNVFTKDDYLLRLSLIAFTVTRTKTSQKSAIRKIMQEYIIEKAKSLTFDELASELVSGRIGEEIYTLIKKIVPIRACDVRKSKLLKLAEEVRARRSRLVRTETPTTTETEAVSETVETVTE